MNRCAKVFFSMTAFVLAFFMPAGLQAAFGVLPSGDGFYELIGEADGDDGFIRIVYQDGEVVTGEVEIIYADGALSVVFEDGAVMELGGGMLFR